MQIIREPVAELLPRAGVLLYSGTTVGLEALALGVPVILLQSDLWFDMDILFFAPGSQTRARARLRAVFARCAARLRACGTTTEHRFCWGVGVITHPNHGKRGS